MTWLAKFWAHRFLIALACWPVWFFAGRWTAPVSAPEVRTETVTRVEYKDRIVERKVVGETRVVYRDRTVYRDGPVQERIVEREASKRDEDATRDETATRHVFSTQTSVITPYQPKWRAGVLVGADLQPAWQPIPGAGVFFVGGTIQRRVAGPLWIGGFALSTGVAGVSATIDF